MTGGSEFVVLSKNGQGSTLVDGAYLAYESNNGFYGSYNSAYGNLTGIRATAANTLTVMQLDGGTANLSITSIANVTTDTDKFLVSDSGVVKYRTGAQVLSDIGGQASGNYLPVANPTFTGTLTGPVITTTGTATIGGATLSGDTFSDPDLLLSILSNDTTTSIRNKISSSTALTKVTDSTAPAPGVFQVSGAYNIQFGDFHTIDEGDTFTFEFWYKWHSGDSTYNLLYAGSSFYNAAGQYLGNTQRYWGESALNINSTTTPGWYHVTGTLGPNRGNNTGDIPTTAVSMQLLFLFNYAPNGTSVTRFCGLKVYKSGQTVTQLYRKTLGSEASTTRNRDLVVDQNGDLYGSKINATGNVTFAAGLQVTSPGTAFYNKFRSGNDYVIGLQDSAGNDQWWLKAYTNGSFAFHENSIGDKFTIAAGGNATFSDQLTISTISNATSDTDKFLVSDSGVIKYRTGAQVLSDIGAASSGSLGNYLPLAGGTMSGTINSTATTALQMDGAASAQGILMRADSSGTYPVFLREQNPASGGETSAWLFKDQVSPWGIWHNNPNDSFDWTRAGNNLGIANNVGGETNSVMIRLRNADGSGTFAGNLTVNGTTTLGNELTFPYGSIGDYIYHTGDGNTFFGFNSSDQWKVTAGGNVGIQLQNTGVYLYYGGNEKIRTTSTGVTVTGDVTAPTFVGALTGNASSASSLEQHGNNSNPNNLNTLPWGKTSNYASSGYWSNQPTGMSYGTVYNFGGYTNNSSLALQIAGDITHNSTSSTKDLWFRMGNNLGFQNDWKKIWNSQNLPNPTQGGPYLPLAGGTLTGGLVGTTATFSGLTTLETFPQTEPIRGEVYSIDPHKYISGVSYWTWTKIAKLDETGHASLRYNCKGDVNYPHVAVGWVTISSYASSSISISHQQIIPSETIQPQVWLDNNRDVWIRMVNASWVTNFQYNWEVVDPNVATIYDGTTQSNTQPANSTVIEVGQEIKFPYTNAAAPVASTTYIPVTTTGNILARNGNITLGGTGRIQGVDTVSATTDAANKAYVDASIPSLANYVTLTTAQTISGAKTFTGQLTVTNGIEMTAGNFNAGDNERIRLGNSADLQIVHDGSNSYIHNVNVGNLYLRQDATDKDIIFESDNGSGGLATYFYIDGSDQLNRFSKNVLLPDNVSLNIGSSFDLQLFHNGTNNYIASTAKDMYYTGSAVTGTSAFSQIFKQTNFNGGDEEYLRISGPTRQVLFSRDAKFIDGIKCTFGTSATSSPGDLEIYHDGTNSIIENTTGDLYIINESLDKDVIIQSDNGATGQVADYFRADGSTGSAILYGNYGTVQLTTNSTGISTNTIDATVSAGSAGNFVVMDGTRLASRTAAQVLSDIGAGTGSGTVTSVTAGDRYDSNGYINY